MKKQIINLVNSEEGVFTLNNIAYLRRWTKDALGNPVDRLQIEFKNINGVNFAIYDAEITHRDYEGIIKECDEKIKLFF